MLLMFKLQIFLKLFLVLIKTRYNTDIIHLKILEPNKKLIKTENMNININLSLLIMLKKLFVI